MSDYAELVKGLRDCSRRNARVCMICGAKASNLCEGTKSKRMFYAADAIEELLDRDVVPTDFHERCLQLEIRKRLELEKQMPHWISVEERLPEKGVYVLCLCRANIYCVMKWDGIDWYENPTHIYMSGFVTHWMPLPSAPKEDAK